MAAGGKVEGVTSDAIKQLSDDTRQHEATGLRAIVAFYAATSDVDREQADRRLTDAYKKALSVRRRRDGLEEIQGEHQASKNDVAEWLKTILDKGSAG